MDGERTSGILGPMFEKLSKDGAMGLKELELSKDAALLDVGTGSGKFAIFLAMQGFDVLTGEPASDETRYARQDWETNAEKVGVRDKIRFEAFDAGDMPFGSERFDAVFFFGVLHHVAEEARAGVVREAMRVAKAAGAAVFFEPRRELLEELWVKDPGHPQAADPSLYVDGLNVRERRMQGEIMDVFVYRKGG